MDPNNNNMLLAVSFRTPVTTCYYGVIVPERCTIRSTNGICLLGYVPAQYGYICNTDLFPQ